jgi:predicted O-methyltransferase YrrM
MAVMELLSDRAERLSMLAPDALEHLTSLAGRAKNILEIGPYVGGSTLALIAGHMGRAKHAAIEVGGSHDHPTIPSDDIVADWRRNVGAAGGDGLAALVVGHTTNAAVRDAALKKAGAKIDLFFMDSDGCVGRDLHLFAHALAEDCVLALDDYNAPEAPGKERMMRAVVDSNVAAGRLIERCVKGGTWFGQMGGARALQFFRERPGFVHNGGHAYIAPCVAGEADSIKGCASALRLFEDGIEIGPGQATHADIRSMGAGRFSHWHDGLWDQIIMTASDNTNPILNGRLYEVDCGGGRVPLATCV